MLSRLNSDSQYESTDRLKILQEGYMICYFYDKDARSYSYVIRTHMTDREIPKFEIILCAPSNYPDYVKDFLKMLRKLDIYDEFLRAPDPFRFIFQHELFEPKSQNMLGHHNDFFLLSDNGLAKNLTKCLWCCI